MLSSRKPCFLAVSGLIKRLTYDDRCCLPTVAGAEVSSTRVGCAPGRTALKRENRLYRGTGLHVGDCLVDVFEGVHRRHLIEGEASALVEVQQLWDE